MDVSAFMQNYYTKKKTQACLLLTHRWRSRVLIDSWGGALGVKNVICI